MSKIGEFFKSNMTVTIARSFLVGSGLAACALATHAIVNPSVLGAAGIGTTLMLAGCDRIALGRAQKLADYRLRQAVKLVPLMLITSLLGGAAAVGTLSYGAKMKIDVALMPASAKIAAATPQP